MTEQQDRRQFYRIQDNVPLHITAISGQTSVPDISQLEQEIPSSFQLINQLREIEAEAGLTLSSLQSSEPAIAEYLRSLTKRLDLIGGYIAEQKFAELKNCESVSISGNGLRINSSENIPNDCVVLVEMLLPNTKTGIHCYGKVVESIKKDQTFTIAITFETIRENDREAIIRHVIRQESKLIREAKEKNS